MSKWYSEHTVCATLSAKEQISQQQQAREQNSSKQADKGVQSENTVAADSQVQQKQTSQQSNEDSSPVIVKAASVLRVVDGDTIEVSYRGTAEKVRLIGVNTPESTIRHQPYGEETSNFTKSRLAGRTVYLVFLITDLLPNSPKWRIFAVNVEYYTIKSRTWNGSP